MNTKYTINIKDPSTLEDDVKKFQKDLETLKCIGYVFPHYFDEKNNISSYGALIIETDKEVDLEYLKKVYNITPNYVYSDFKKIHYVFLLERGISELDYNRAGKVLEFILGGEAIDYHFFPGNNITRLYTNDTINIDLVQFLNSLNFSINKNRKVEREFSKNNYIEYLKANEIQFKEIFSKLKIKQLADVDPIKNIHLKHGYPFDFVMSFFQSLSKTFEFFNKNFGLHFQEETKEQRVYTQEGVLLEEGTNFFRNTIGYYVLLETGRTIQITDFFIKVHYKILNLDGTYNYVVSLVNELCDDISEKIIFTNTTALTTFSDFIQRYGNFHFYGNVKHIKDIHRAISNLKGIPSVKNIVGYGYQKDEGIIIFKNGIWDLQDKVFTEKKDNDSLYFNYNHKGYFITDKQGNSLSKIIQDGIPTLNTEKTVEMEEVLNFLNMLYKDDTGEFLLYIAFGMFGYLLFGNQKDPFPFIFAKGITGSGKSTFNQLLQRMWGIDKGGTDFGTSSPFTMTIKMSHLIKFPYFLGEYREDVEQVSTKKRILRSAFDRKEQTKGRADQTIITYSYTAMAVMDGEEMIGDGAVRTRTIQRQFLKAHRTEDNFQYLVKKYGEVLDHVLYTYLLKASKKRYLQRIEECTDYFNEYTKNSSSRIGDNFINIYAGCYAFSDKYRQDYIRVLTKSLEFQIQDYNMNGTSQEIIKAIAKYLDNISNTAYNDNVEIVGDNVIIPWNSLEDYLNKFKVKLSLQTETYKEHIEAMGYQVGYLDNGVKLIYGVIVPINKIPKEFLIHPAFYQASKMNK